MPLVRSSFAPANSLSKFRKLVTPVSAVIWWTIASGSARSTTCRTAAASRPSATAGSAPIALIASAFSAERVMPTTSWPLETRSGTRRLPDRSGCTCDEDLHGDLLFR